MNNKEQRKAMIRENIIIYSMIGTMVFLLGGFLVNKSKFDKYVRHDESSSNIVHTSNN